MAISWPRIIVLLGLLVIVFLLYHLSGNKMQFPVVSAKNKVEEESMAVSTLERAFTMRFEDYNPQYVISAVNALRELEKKEALRQIEQYIDHHQDANESLGVFWVLRVLFDVPSDPGFPPVALGKPDIPPPENVELFPRYPIVLVQDVPFLVVHGYMLRGLPVTVTEHVAYFKAHGSIREKPLHPVATSAAIEEEFTQLWSAAYGEEYKAVTLHTIRAQLARMAGRQEYEQ